MKTRLPLPLLAAIISGFSTCQLFATDAALGNVMYVGDSITHGVNSGSYRWSLHKIFVDNGISYTPKGVNSGNFSGGITTGTVYGNQVFFNVHSSQSSARAYEISGRQKGGRFNNSNIQNWLGQSTIKTDGSAYTESTFTGNNTPDTFFLMIGTNDLLSDGNSATLGDRIETATQTLLGDVSTIVGSMQQSNANANIIITTIPTWTQHANGNSVATHKAVSDYNKSLQSWAQGKNGITVVDVNKGIIDVTSATPFYGVSSMFKSPGSDGLHPNAQGDLIIAGNIAQSMGYAGRTAGQLRKGTESMTVNFHPNGGAPSFDGLQNLIDAGFSTTNVSVSDGKIDMGLSGMSQLSYTWAAGSDLRNGFTFDFNLSLGDGSNNGWNLADNLSVSVGNGSLYGTLNINEGYIKWNNDVLYSADMSANKDNLRLSYVKGNDAEGLKSGYYLWLGDMLIGEALSATIGAGTNGVTIRYDGAGNAIISNLALDGSGAYAPTSTGISDPEKAFISAGSSNVPTSPPEGIIDWKDSGFTQVAPNLTASGTFNARTQVDSSAGATGNTIGATITSGTASYIYANLGDYKGDVWLTISGGSSSSWSGGHGGISNAGTLTGNVNIRFTDAAAGSKGVFGAVNATNITGNVYLEFSAENATYGSFTSTNPASVIGAYATNIGGNVDIVINEGTFSNQIIGGQFYTPSVGKGKTIGGSTHIFVNGGTIQGDVVGGGLTGIISGNTGVTVTGGSIDGNVYGASKSVGAADADISIGKNSSVTITSGVIKGNVYGAGKGGTVHGDSSTSIIGNTARIHNGTTWGNISAGGISGTVTGNSTVLIQDLADGDAANGFDKYAGTISGGNNVAGTKTLILDNVTVGTFNATLSNFNSIDIINRTNTFLNNLGGATTLSLEAGCSLIVNGTSDLTTLFLGQHSSFSLQGFTADEVIIDITGASNYNLALTNIPDDFSNIKFKSNGKLYDASWSIDKQANTANLFAAVPEPGTVSLGLLGVCLLLTRRRRHS